eukprot:jgi/Bigna1/134934/aug1.27_g9642
MRALSCSHHQHSCSSSTTTQAIPEREIKEVCKFFTIQDFEAGDVIIKKGDPSNTAYCIVSGSADIVLKEEKEGKGRIQVTVGANNFLGGFGLITGEDNAAGSSNQVVKEPVSVVGARPGMYVKLPRDQLQRLQQVKPKIYKTISELIALRAHLLTDIPFFKQVTSRWPKAAFYTFASLFQYQAFFEHEELIAESGKQADKLIVLIRGTLNVANMRKGNDMYQLTERGKLINLTSLFYNFSRLYWDIVASPNEADVTQIMTLRREDFRKFIAAEIIDSYDAFERASIEYVLREMRSQQRLFLHVVEEADMTEFCSLWKLKEYGENVKVTMAMVNDDDDDDDDDIE